LSHAVSLSLAHFFALLILLFYSVLGLASDSLGVSTTAAVAAYCASSGEEALARHSIRTLFPHERRSDSDGGRGSKLHVLGVCRGASEGRPGVYAARGEGGKKKKVQGGVGKFERK